MKYYHGFFLILIALVSVLIVPVTVSAQEAAPIKIAAYTEEAILFREIPSVYGASKYEQKVTEAPSSVSIITSDEIKKYGYRTLADILRGVRGFYVTYNRNYSFVGVRGFSRPGDYNSRILLLIDGHRLNDNVYDGVYVGSDAIVDIDLIDRVEIIRGPGSSLYGSNAFFAVINVITRRGRDVKSMEVSAERGSFDTTKGRTSYGNRFSNGVETLLSGSAYESKGQDLFYPELGWTTGTDADRFGQGFLKTSYRDLTLAGAYSSRTKGIPTGAYFTDFGDPGNWTKDQRAYLDAAYDRRLGDHAELAVGIYYDYYRYYGNYKYTGVTNRDSGYGTWYGGEIKVITTALEHNRIIAGLEYRDNLRQEQMNYDVDPYTLYLHDKRDSDVLGMYVQDEIAFSRAVMLTAGVRYDHYSTFGSTTNPRLALVLTPLEQSSIKFLYGTAFRAPNNFELYFQSSTNEPNPRLQPEEIATYELVLEHFSKGGLQASLSGYYYRARNMIDQVEIAPTVMMFQNKGVVTAQGAELGIEQRWQGGFEGRFSYTLQRAEDEATGEPLTNSPAQMAKLHLTLPLFRDHLFTGIEELMMSKRRTVQGNYAGGASVTNVTFYTRHLVERLDVSISVYNLFDKDYADPVSSDFVQDTIPQDGRNYRVKLVYSF